MPKIIIALTGKIASGKEETKKHLINKYNAQGVAFSGMLRDVLQRINVPIERKNLQTLSTILRNNFGEDLLARNIVEDAKKMESEIVVMDGVRRLIDISYAKKFDGFVLVSIDADVNLRYERMKNRNQNVGDDKKSLQDFLKDHESEADKELPVVMAEATEHLDNNGSLDDLHKQIDALVSKYL